MDGRIRKFALLVLAVCALVGAAVAWLQRTAAVDAVGASQWVEHTQAVRLRAERVRATLYRVNGSVANYMLERNGSFAERFAEARASLAQTLGELNELTRDNAAQQERLAKLAPEIRGYLDDLRRFMSDPAASQSVTLAQIQLRLDQIVMELDRFDATEAALLASRREDMQRERARLMVSVALGAFALCLLFGALVVALMTAETRRRTAEAEARYRYLFQLNPMPMWVFDTESLRFLDVNEVALHKYGYSREQFLQLTLRDVRPSEEVPAMEAAVIANQQSQRIWRHRLGDGSLVDVLIHTRDVFIEGRRARMAVVEDVSERERALSLLAHREEQLLALSRGLMTAQEDERRAIARELHDDLVQSLAAVKLAINFAQRETQTTGSRVRLGDASRQIDDMITRVRDRALDLHPAVLDEVGLVPALEWYCDRETERRQLPVRVESMGNIRRLDPVVELTAYRIVQEAVGNAVRHSGASRVDVSVHAADGRLHVLIRDDGCGMATVTVPSETRRSLGLRSMNERAEALGGTLKIDSAPGHGTTVRAELPTLATETA
ncbi:MAG TPA: ATP-binding protein [Burkholderiaceae bacterium]|nr:ATP-binding protein [Burkholderiaceae bacterium]